jgi:hypothetical protein
LHFPSDNDFAKEVGEKILKHKEFAKKYGIWVKNNQSLNCKLQFADI